MKDILISPLQASRQAPASGRADAAAGGRTEPAAGQDTGKDVPPVQAPEVPQVDLSRVVESLNDYLQSVRRDLRFSVDDVSGRTIITVLDSESEEVIRQIPPESVQAMAAHLRSEGSLVSFGLIEEA